MSHAPPQEKPRVMPGSVAWIGAPAGFAMGALCAITLAFYHRLWLPDLILIKRDAFGLFVPLKQYMVERLSVGELPQWFPYEGLGRSYIGVPHTGVFHPFTALYFLLSVPDAYRVSTLLSCLLAAAGTFVLGRMLHFSRAGAVLAGLTYTLSGFVVSVTDAIVYLYSICVLPLFCAALEKALGGSRAWTVVPAVVWATVLLNGDVQTGYYYGFIALLWVVARASSPYWETSLRLAIVCGLTALLAGIQLSPAWAVFVDSDRTEAAIFHEQALYWATHPLRLLTVLASPIDQNADPVKIGTLFFGTHQREVWAESVYLGIPVAGLALLGARHRRDLRVLTILGILALLLALGQRGGLYEVFYHVVPLWSAFRYPEKLMGIVSFAAAMLAGAGLDAFQAGKGHCMPWLGVAILCIGAWGALSTEPVTAWTAATFHAPADLAFAVTHSTGLAFLFSAVAALGVWLVTVGSRSGWLRESLAFAVLIAIVALDLSRANLAAYHTGPSEAATFTPPLAEALKAREGTLAPGRFRLISFSKGRVVAPEDVFQVFGIYGTTSVLRRQTLDLEHNAQFHIELATRYMPGHTTAFASLVAQKPGIEAAARYNVAYYIGRSFHFQAPRFAASVVAALPGYDLVLAHNPVPLKPRVYLSQRPERASSPVDPVVLLSRPDFLSGEVDVIETSDATLPDPALSGSAVIERYAPEEVRVRVATPQPAVLILLDSFDKGWTATLESGLDLPIMRANALVRAVAVPAGTHLVTFSYQTPLLKAGAWASLAGVLLCTGILAHARWRLRCTESGK